MFQCVYVELIWQVIEVCKVVGVLCLYQMSLFKVGQGLSQYFKICGEVEVLVCQFGLCWMLYQFSVIFGDGDGLVGCFVRIFKLMLVLLLVCVQFRFVLIFVGDVVEVIVCCVVDDKCLFDCSFELYGLQVLILGEIVKVICDVVGLCMCILLLFDVFGWLQVQFVELLLGKLFLLDNFCLLCIDLVGKVDGYVVLSIVLQLFMLWLEWLIYGLLCQCWFDYVCMLCC